MKKLLFSVCFLLSTVFVSYSQDAKGPRGGTLIGSESVRFEYVQNANTYSFYPVDQNGAMLKTVPLSANIEFTLQLISETESYKDVKFDNGCYTVKRTSDIPVYIVKITTTQKDKEIVVKYRTPGMMAK